MADDIPDELLPDEPKHIGDVNPEDAEIYDCVFPEDSWDEFDSPVDCDDCGKELDKGHVGFTPDSKEPVYLCSGCHMKGVMDAVDRAKEEFDPDDV